MREVVEVAGKDPGAGLRRLSDRGEGPVDRPSAPGVFARLDDMLARHRAGRPPAAVTPGSGLTDAPGRVSGWPGRFRGRVRVPQGQGHAPDRHLGEGGPRDRGRGRSDGACSRTARVRLMRGRGHAGSRRPRRPRFHGRDAEREVARGHRPGSGPGTGRRASRRRSTATTAGSPRTRPVPAPTPGSPTGCPPRPRNHCRRERIPWRVPAAAATAGGPDGRRSWAAAARRGMTGAKGPSPGRRRRGGVLRTHEDGIRPSRASGGAYPRRDARPGRRRHPLARPRAHQTAARLDESGTIPSKPGNGCVITSKKTSAAPYPG